MDRSSGLTESRYGQNPSDNPVGTVAAALISSGISLAGNPDFFESDFLSGRCLCRRKVKDGLEFPCSNITLVLSDLEGREVGRVTTTDGEFVFPVKRDEQYQIRAVAKKYYIPSETERILHRGDDVVLHLVLRHSSGDGG
jgi:hypothetical protein